jgi:hypothetical protein
MSATGKCYFLDFKFKSKIGKYSDNVLQRTLIFPELVRVKISYNANLLKCIQVKIADKSYFENFITCVYSCKTSIISVLLFTGIKILIQQ